MCDIHVCLHMYTYTWEQIYLLYTNVVILYLSQMYKLLKKWWLFTFITKLIIEMISLIWLHITECLAQGDSSMGIGQIFGIQEPHIWSLGIIWFTSTTRCVLTPFTNTPQNIFKSLEIFIWLRWYRSNSVEFRWSL